MLRYDLAQILKADLARAGDGDRVVTIHLFGVRHAQLLDGMDLGRLAEEAGIGKSYGTEIRKGVRLAEHVVLRTA